MVKFGRRILLAEDPNSAFSKMLAAEKAAVGVDGDRDREGAQAKVWEAKSESGVGGDMLGKADSGEVDLDDRDDAEKVCEGRLLQSEGKSRGGVAMATHSTYILASDGVMGGAVIVPLFVASMSVQVRTSVFLTKWSENSRLLGYKNSGHGEKLFIYAILSAIASLLPIMA
eukprot:Plantae.Rhodophyta-Palmaria_palmata.ctg16978.p3 GENE.Plantae.Rhodophyta-Palmaria_palmata.ctg16978~~Plantae.Rhodophyta-Palmaria_palmata.ctg16978.p3  ORF type:complete len:171 (-),score=41.77 Plantae.Rhodophyta-Palmaria_palmata.ctg16978:375-887(-)